MGFDFVNTLVQPPSGSTATGQPASFYNPPSRVGVYFQLSQSSGGYTSASFLFVNGILVATGSGLASMPS